MIKPYLVILSLALLLYGCDTCDRDDCFVPADPFKFRIIDKDSKEDLVFSENPRYQPDSIRLFYYQDGKKIELPLQDLTREDHYGELSNQTLPYISAVAITKDFYLQFSFQDVDTLLIDVRQIDFNCCTVFQYAESYINGRVMIKSSDYNLVFLVEK
jgi:hypothetical protein